MVDDDGECDSLVIEASPGTIVSFMTEGLNDRYETYQVRDLEKYLVELLTT